MKRFTIFGNPVKHSISPKMHTFAIKGLGVRATYDKTLLLDGSRLKEIFLDKKLDGANVTVPHKEEAYRQADEIRGIAQKIKAVNTLVLEKDKIIGYNTDASGFYESIKEYKADKVLILGAGGTAKAISFYLKEKGMDITILNRSAKRLQDFIDIKTFTWDDFIIENFDMVVNTTSAGLSDESYPTPKELLEKIFDNSKIAIDVIYNKQTPFLKLAQNKNLITKDGADMLLFQGVKAFNLFFQNRFDEKEIEKYMRKAFN